MLDVAESNLNFVGQIVAKPQDIQAQETKQSKESIPASGSGATQAGARRYPEPPFPPQHQPKPGDEDELVPVPMYDAPFYRGSGKLQDKVAIVMVETLALAGRWRCCSPAKARMSRSFI
jgi:hypothetical protein